MNREQRRAWRRDMRRRARSSRKEKGTDMLAKHKWQITTIQVLEDVFAERIRQVAKYGHNEELEDGTGQDVDVLPSSPFGGSMTAEEFEDICRADYEFHEKLHGAPTWMHLVREEVAESFKEDDPTRLEQELLQVAALCVSWVEKLRRRGQKGDGR